MTDTHFFICLTRPNSKRWSVKSVMGFLTTWLVVQMLVICFQCSLPEPWRFMGNKCINLVRLSHSLDPCDCATSTGRRLTEKIACLLDQQRGNRCHNTNDDFLPSSLPSFRPPPLQRAKGLFNALVHPQHDVRTNLFLPPRSSLANS